MFAAASPCAWRTPFAARPRYAPIAWLAAGAFGLGAATNAAALTPESPEVIALVDDALGYLETVNNEERLGGKCLIALAFHKAGRSIDHPKIVEAIEACRTSLEAERSVNFIYSKALAVIFLAELDSPSHRGLLEQYAALLNAHQKEHGGFGYINLPTGDTSQTQYLALAYWEMLNHGISPDADSVQACLKWLMRTQDPGGAWGYQGQDPGRYDLAEQTDRVGRSMAAAGMGGTLILGNALGLLTTDEPSPGALATESVGDLPPALRRVEEGRRGRAPTLPPGNVEPQRLAECVGRGRVWMNENFGITVDEWQFYYLYSVERYKSFDEYLQGGVEESPWYDEGVKLLQTMKFDDGSYSDGCGTPCATAFATLFLLRSTQQSIKSALGEGTLVGGRGLPRDLSTVRLRGGRLVIQQNPTELDALLDMMEEGDAAEYDALTSNPAALEITEVTPEAARRLQQIVRSGPPDARLLAVRALSSAREMDYAPTLIFALTDPHRPVVRAARDGLRSVSRSFEGFGPPDNFDDNQRDEAIVRWKEWYQTARPDAAPLP